MSISRRKPRKAAEKSEVVSDATDADPGEPAEADADLSDAEPEPAELEGELSHELSGDLAHDLPDIGPGVDDATDNLDAPPSETRAIAKAEERSLARYDPLTRYIEEVRRYPLLTREEEHELAVEYVKTGDLGAARRLITANLRLVIKIAHEYHQAQRNLLDLIQEGNIGLMQAVKKYDPYRGVKLSSYAAWWIRAYILKAILNNWRMVKIGTTQAQRRLFFNLRKERDKLEREGFVPEAKMLAERLDVTEREVVDMERRLGAGDLSLDQPVGHDDEGGRSHLDLLEASGDVRPDVTAESDEFRAMLREKLAAFERTLSGREKTIFDERLFADTPLTLQEIGERYGISRERARQLEKRLSDKLRIYLRAEMGDAVQVAMGLEE